jgi:hypothetical protein
VQPIHLRKNLPTVVEDYEQNLTPRLLAAESAVARVEADRDRHRHRHRRD